MFCPNCAAPIEGTKFCRSCGANVSLIPQALSGQLPVERPAQEVDDDRHRRRRRHHEHQPSMAGGIQRMFMGIGFICVALGALFWVPAGQTWWFWMLIPAFALLGGGVAEIVRAKQEAAKITAPPAQQFSSWPQPQPVQAAPRTNELPPRQDLHGSIVEGTTRHLDPSSRSSE